MYNLIELKRVRPVLEGLILALPWLIVVALALDFPGWPTAARCFSGFVLLSCALWDGHLLALRDGITRLRLTETGLAVERHGDGEWQPARIAHASRLFGGFVILRLRIPHAARTRQTLLFLSVWPWLANIDPEQMRRLRTWLHLNPPPHTTNRSQ